MNVVLFCPGALQFVFFCIFAVANCNKLIFNKKYESVRDRFHYDSRFV